VGGAERRFGQGPAGKWGKAGLLGPVAALLKLGCGPACALLSRSYRRAMVAISEWYERERVRQEILELEELARQLLERSRRVA